jgi:hypothetical protein
VLGAMAHRRGRSDGGATTVNNSFAGRGVMRSATRLCQTEVEL